MYQKINKRKPAYDSDDILEAQLKTVFASPKELQILIDYLTVHIQNTEEEYIKAAKRAVFVSDARDDALLKFGMIKGMESFIGRLIYIYTNNK